MQHHEWKWTVEDGEILYAQGWDPDRKVVGVVCLVHGLGEHSGRYAHVARFFSQRGYAMLGFDLRGHGQTSGKRGYAGSYDVIMDEIAYLLKEACERYPGLPIFLYGHSLGGNLVINYALRRRPEIAGVIATSPGLGTSEKPPAYKVLLGKLLYNVMPSFTMPNGLDVDGLSRDPQVAKAYKSDPLVHDQISARLGLDLLSTGQWALEHAADFPLPLLLVHGTADRLTSCPLSEQFAQSSPASTTFKKWEGGYHELHNEPEKEQVLQTFVDWMEKVRTSQ